MESCRPGNPFAFVAEIAHYEVIKLELSPQNGASYTAFTPWLLADCIPDSLWTVKLWVKRCAMVNGSHPCEKRCQKTGFRRI